MVYLNGSEARGVFCQLIYLSPSGIIDFTKSVIIVVMQHDHQPLSSPIPIGTYMVLGYDVENDGRIEQGESLYPAHREILIAGTNIGILTT